MKIRKVFYFIILVLLLCSCKNYASEQSQDLPNSIINDENQTLVLIPEGKYRIGKNGFEETSPEHKVTLNPYYIDVYEVTYANYFEFLVEMEGIHEGAIWVEIDGKRAQIYRIPTRVWPDGYENYPVVGVTWYEAQAYCNWRGGRLPTEAEWEAAAKGAKGYKYPWGNKELSCEDTNDDSCYLSYKQVGSLENDKSLFGVFDMAGNVSEWVLDWWDPEYYSYSPNMNPSGPVIGYEKVVRGGNYFFGFDEMALFYFRFHANPQERYEYIGFRCVIPVSD